VKAEPDYPIKSGRNGQQAEAGQLGMWVERFVAALFWVRVPAGAFGPVEAVYGSELNASTRPHLYGDEPGTAHVDLPGKREKHEAQFGPSLFSLSSSAWKSGRPIRTKP